MSEFKALDGEKPFIQPESPFLLLTEDVDGNVSYCWWNNKKIFRKTQLKEEDLENGSYVL